MLSRGCSYFGDITMPKKIDIVYILKGEFNCEELRYSLRSVEKNFPHRFVWFVGGQPKGFHPDRAIQHKQVGSTKWDMIKSSMWKAVENEEVSDDFFLFNDDFFVMKKFEGEFVNYVDMTLSERIDEMRRNVHPWLNPYGRTLFKAEQELISLGCPTMNYDVHLPMVFNKELFKASINKCSSPQMRSVYGNLNAIPFVIHQDVKVYDMETIPETPDFLSTNEGVFEKGRVGAYIREQFPTPSRWEG